MKSLLSSTAAPVATLLIAAATTLATPSALAQGKAAGKTITLCWAAWDPANALVELSKDFTAKTGMKMKFEFVPWTSFADRFLNELNSKGKLCDLMIGDSQWIGGAAENGHYVKLNDFFAKEGIKMTDFMPATVDRLLGVAEEHAQLLGAAGDGRRGGLDLPQGLVRTARARKPSSRRSTAASSPRRRPGPSSSRSPSSSRAGDRRQEGLRRLHLHRARLGGHHHGRDQRALRLRLPATRTRSKPYTWTASSTRPTRCGTRVLQVALQVLHAARARPTPTCRKGSTPSSRARWRCR